MCMIEFANNGHRFHIIGLSIFFNSREKTKVPTETKTTNAGKRVEPGSGCNQYQPLFNQRLGQIRLQLEFQSRYKFRGEMDYPSQKKCLVS